MSYWTLIVLENLMAESWKKFFNSYQTFLQPSADFPPAVDCPTVLLCEGRHEKKTTLGTGTEKKKKGEYKKTVETNCF
jgi:hypothetical protein